MIKKKGVPYLYHFYWSQNHVWGVNYESIELMIDTDRKHQRNNV